MRRYIRICGREVRQRSVLGVAVLFMAVYYATLLTNGSFDLLRPVYNGFTFNSMAAHLLEGRFDVDPSTIGDDGFVHEGRTYAYFGIFLAFLRAPLLIFRALPTTDVTRLSCLVAACVMGYCKLAALNDICRCTDAGRSRGLVFWPLAFTFILGGAQIQFLKASIFQEVVSWGSAFAGAFVYCCIRGLVVERQFSGRLLAAMAALAGFALLARVSIGVGLYAALGLLLFVLAWQAPMAPVRRIASVVSQLFTKRLAWPLAILLLLAALTGLVNYERWGNPLTFVDLHQQIFINEQYPDRIPRLERYGNFNIARLWFGTLYYFIPIWMITRADGKFLYYEWQQDLVDAAELPPSSFILSDPLLLGFCGALVLWRQRQRALVDSPQSAALLLGLSAGPLLILTASYMSFRYRMEFYPLFELGALVGLFVTFGAPMAVARPLARAIWAAAAISIVASHVLLALYKLSPFGPATAAVGPAGVLEFYLRAAGELALAAGFQATR